MNRQILRITLASAILGIATLVAYADEAKSSWNGYDRYDFIVDGRACLLVAPKTPAEGTPWIWRTEFFDVSPQADLALLEKGYHVGYMDVQNMYGAPVALDHMDKYYDYVTANRGLSRKCVLEGFSRGGLFAFNWAARHPERVASIYVDAPVCDIKSWPGGKGKSPGSQTDWELCKKAYDLSEGRAIAYRRNPIDNLKPLAEHKVPILAVCGDADVVVPMDENILIVEKRYQKLGGEIKIIAKPGIGHHPHSLEDPTEIVNFILSHP